MGGPSTKIRGESLWLRVFGGAERLLDPGAVCNAGALCSEIDRHGLFAGLAFGARF